MTVPTLKKLLYAAIFAVLVLAVRVAMPSTAAFEGVYKQVSAGTASPRSPASIPRSVKYYNSCWKTGGPDTTPTGVVHKGVDAMPAVRERYKLYSTFLIRSPNKRKGYAAIAYDRQERVYTENEKVGEYVLAQVFPDRVILKKGGVSFILERALGVGQAISPPSSRSRSSTETQRREKALKRRRGSQPRADRQGVEEAGQADIQQLTVSETDRDYITENFAKILHDVNLQTEIAGEYGTMTGVKIGHIKPGSILYKVGHLRSGDIIKKVNGTPINSIHQALSLYGSLTKQNVKKVNAEIERNGKLFNRTYSITNQGAD